MPFRAKRLMRHLLLAALVIPLAGGAGAATLCRDSKGLFTPCPPGAAPSHRKHGKPAAETMIEDPAPVTPPPAGKVAAARAKKAPLLKPSKLCRDSKGLFTPCLR